jgi:hypothetical protein
MGYRRRKESQQFGQQRGCVWRRPKFDSPYGQVFLFLPLDPKWLRGSHNLVSDGYRGLSSGVKRSKVEAIETTQGSVLPPL